MMVCCGSLFFSSNLWKQYNCVFTFTKCMEHLNSFFVEKSMKSSIVARGWKNAIMRMDYKIELRCVLLEISNK